MPTRAVDRPGGHLCYQLARSVGISEVELREAVRKGNQESRDRDQNPEPHLQFRRKPAGIDHTCERGCVVSLVSIGEGLGPNRGQPADEQRSDDKQQQHANCDVGGIRAPQEAQAPRSDPDRQTGCNRARQIEPAQQRDIQSGELSCGSGPRLRKLERGFDIISSRRHGHS